MMDNKYEVRNMKYEIWWSFKNYVAGWVINNFNTFDLLNK
jgi:hypothetical protein